MGDRGGGDATTQTETLLKIVDYIRLHISNEEIEAILPQLYNLDKNPVTTNPITIEGKTFYPAITGNWKTFFEASHKEVFKEALGQTLIDLGYEKDFDW